MHRTIIQEVLVFTLHCHVQLLGSSRQRSVNKEHINKVCIASGPWSLYKWIFDFVVEGERSVMTRRQAIKIKRREKVAVL